MGETGAAVLNGGGNRGTATAAWPDEMSESVEAQIGGRGCAAAASCRMCLGAPQPTWNLGGRATTPGEPGLLPGGIEAL